MKRRLILDGQFLITKEKTGVEHVALNIVDQLLKNKDFDCQICFFDFFFCHKTIKHIIHYKRMGAKVKCCWWMPYVLFNKLNRWGILKYNTIFANKAALSLFFFNYVPYGVNNKIAVYIHDVAPLVVPENVPHNMKEDINENLKKYIKRADKILTVSHFSKDEIIKYCEVENNKIGVVYNGIDTKKFNCIKEKEKIEKVIHKYNCCSEYILYLGTIDSRKNILTLIEAYELLKKQLMNKSVPHLVVAGKNGWDSDKIYSQIKHMKILEDIIFTGYVEEEDVPQLVKGARLFVFPSMYEGFGIPVIEAMACGIPTVVSNSASLPEIVGDGAVVLKENSAEELMTSMKMLLENKGYYDEMATKAVQRAKQFSWDNSYKQLLEQIYE